LGATKPTMRSSVKKKFGNKLSDVYKKIEDGKIADATKIFDQVADALIKRQRKKKKKGPSVKAISTHFESNRRKH
jgi:hypothetical protein